jgi:hypothetical protein
VEGKAPKLEETLRRIVREEIKAAVEIVQPPATWPVKPSFGMS